MRIRFQNTIEDLVAFNIYFLEHTPHLKRARRFGSVFVFFVAFIATLFVLFVPMRSILRNVAVEVMPGWITLLTLAVMFVIAAGIGAFCYWGWEPFSLSIARSNIRKLYEKQHDKIVMAEKALEIVGQQLVQRHEFGEERVNISAIEDTVTTPYHVFVRISSMRAYILPRREFRQDELEQFLEELDNAREEMPPVVTLASPEAPMRATSADIIRRESSPDSR